jgi:hypothetical protein
MAGQAGAVALADCTRTTHVSHGDEAQHADLGEGRVMWLNWWSQEGTAKTYVLVDCESGETLSMRTQEDNMGARLPFDRTKKALKIIADEHRAARAFATLPRIAAALEKTARDIELTTLIQEPCACAALYADLRGDREAFELKDALP